MQTSMSFLIKSWGLVRSNFYVDCTLFGLNMFTEKVSNNGGVAIVEMLVLKLRECKHNLLWYLVVDDFHFPLSSVH